MASAGAARALRCVVRAAWPTLPCALLTLAAAAQDAPPPPESARMVGRLLLADGSPAAGARLELKTWATDFPDTAADGRFELRFPPVDWAIALRAQLAGHALFVRRWREIAPGQQIDLGSIRLVPSGDVVGRVVDSAGDVLVRNWQVGGTHEGRFGGWPPDVHASVDPQTGEFRLRGLHPGPVRVQARSVLDGTTETREVQVPRAGSVSVDLLYAGPVDLRRRIVVALYASPFRGLEPDLGAIRLIRDGGEVRAWGPLSRSSWRIYDDVPPGNYRIEIDDPRFEPWSRDDVRPGDFVEANLAGNAALRVWVVDAETGQPFERFGLAVDYHETSAFDVEVHDARQPLPPRSEFRDLVPAPLTLVVRVPERAEQRVEVTTLQPNEVELVRVEVPPPTPLSGIVLAADGKPAKGVEVEWTPGTDAGQRVPPEFITATPPPVVQEVLTTDDAGRFRLSRAAVGMHTLRVLWSPWLFEDRSVQLPLQPGVELELRAPPAGWLEGRVLLPERVDYELQLELQPAHDGSSRADAELDADGSFRCGPLPAGELDLRLSMTQELELSSSTTSRRLGTVTVRAGDVSRCEFSVRETLPGSIQAVVTVDGIGFSGGLVALIGDGRGGDRGVGRGSRRLLSFVDPGVHEIVVRSADREWVWVCPTPIEVLPGEVRTVELDIALCERRVRFLDAGGRPVADRRIGVSLGGVHALTFALETTDAEGRVTLTLPAGEVRFFGGERPAPYGRFVTVDWGPGDEELVVRFPERIR